MKVKHYLIVLFASLALVFKLILPDVLWPATAMGAPLLQGSTPLDERWEGTTNLGRPMSFDIVSDGTEWRNFKLETRVQVGPCNLIVTTTVFGPGDITNNQFSWNGSTFSFSGQFDSPTTASGTYAYVNRSVPGCGIFSQSGTWTANHTTLPPPISPDNLTALALSQMQILLNWDDNSDNESGFKIEQSFNGTSNWMQIATTPANVTSHAPPGLICSATYYYRVRAYNASGNSEPSNTAHATTLSCDFNLFATPVSETQIDLSWDDNSDNESGFKIERAPDGTGDWIEVAMVGANVTTYSDTGLTCSTSYGYRIRAYNAAGNSDYSNTANAATFVCRPSKLIATPISQTEINLSWTDNSDDENGFKIERSPNGTSGWSQIATVGADTTTYPDTGLTCNTPYHYRVRAYNATGDSAYSNTADTTTIGCNTAPTLTDLPDQVVPMNGSADNAIDLWAYASDDEDPDPLLTFAIVNSPDNNVGVTIDTNRYIDINPVADWSGSTEVQIQVQDTGGLTAPDTFRVIVTGSTVYLPLVLRNYPP